MKKQTDRHFFCTLTGAGILLVGLCLFTGSPLLGVAIAADIQGQVIFDDTSAVAPYAAVRLYNKVSDPVSVSADMQGRFSIPLTTDMKGTVSLTAEPFSVSEGYDASKPLKIEITDTSASLVLPLPVMLTRIGKITGMVRKDSATGTLAANARVIAETQDDTDIGQRVAETNADGVFTLDVPARYSWTVHAEPPSTEDYKQYAFSDRIPVKITDPETPYRLTDPLTLKFAKVKHITGTITYNGNPVSGVTVSADNWNEPDTYKSLVTSTDGKFDIWVTPGTFEIRVAQTQGADWVSPAPQEVSFSEDMSAETETLNIELATAESRLLGTILDPDGKPLTSASGPNTGVTIDLVGAKNRYSRSVNPDAEGKFSFPVPAGLYEISMWLDEDIYPQYDTPASETLRISKGEKKPFVLELYDRNIIVRGSVTTLDGKGIPGVRVAAWEAEAEDDWYVEETDIFGNYKFTLSAGEWTIKPLISGMFINDCFQEIDLEDGETAKQLEPFKIDSNRSEISGAVTDESGKLLEDVEAVVYARPDGDDPSPVAESWVVKGRFSLTVPSGKVYVGLYLMPGNKYCFAGGNEIAHSKREEIIRASEDKMTPAPAALADPNPYEQITVVGSISSNRKSLKETKTGRQETSYDVTFKLKENKTFIEGKLTDSAGKPVSGVKGHVIAISADHPGLWQSGDINPTDGAFKIPAGKGLWSVSYGIETKQYLPYPMKPIDVEVPAEGMSVEKNITLISLTRTIRGRVQDESGNPVSNVEVWGKSNRMTENFFEMPVFSGADGTFEIPMPPQDMVQKSDIPRGSKQYKECISTAVSMCGSASNSCYREAKTGCQEQYLRDSSLKEDTEVVLVLRKAEAYLEGKVLDEDGNPVKGALVSAYSEDGQNAHGNTDKDGMYKLQVAKADSIEGKTWEVSATYKPAGSSTCYQSQAEDVVMETDQTPVPDLNLESWADLPPVQAYEFKVENGWSYTLSDGLQIRIPPNAVKTREKNVKIMIQSEIAGLPDNDEDNNLRYGYNISVYEKDSGKQILEKFNKKIMFCFRFSKAWIDNLGVRASDIRPAYFSEMSNSWQPIKSFIPELKDGMYKIFFQTDHLSSWGLVASRTGAVQTALGDVNGDSGVGLADAILALQLCSESPTSADVKITTAGDADGDGKIGLAEVIYILQSLIRTAS